MSLPGRLGDPQMSLATDPRTHRGLFKGLEANGMQHNAFLSADISPDAPLENIVAFARSSEQSLETMINEMDFDVKLPWSSAPTEQTSISTIGVNNNNIHLTIYRPKNQHHPLPAILYFHGGGMVMLPTSSPLHTSHAKSLAQLGFISILISFRNVLPPDPKDPLQPFPSGLNDCISATKSIHASKRSLKISEIILHGDSGGANLALATALSLNQSLETQSLVSGIFVLDPYISGSYQESREWKLAHLPSLVECDGYDVSCSASALYATLYDSSPAGTNPNHYLAWPFWADADVIEMKGLPRLWIGVAELDPLRDEGREFVRKLERAGVDVVGVTRKGMTHTGELLLRKWVPELYAGLLMELRGFIEGLGR